MDDLAAVVPLLERRSFKSGQLVFSKGDRANELFIVLTGRMKISVLSGEGRELAFRAVGPGEIVGEIGVLDDGFRTADMTSVSQSDVLLLGKTSLSRILNERPAISRALILFLCQRLRDTTEQLESIALYQIEARIARFLLALAKQTRSDAGKVDVSLLLSQTELGNVLGASRPKVNVALNNLEECGAIRRHGSRLTCDRDKLLAIAEDGT